eukprot:jgi/Tetstr1/438030/TSEL_026657.t1
MVERCTRTQLAYASVEENTLQNRLTDEDMRGEYIHLPGGWTPTHSSNPALYRSLRHAWHWHTLLDVGADALAQYKLFLLDQLDLDGDIVDADTRLTYLRGSDSVWLQGAEDMLEIAAKQAAVLVEHDDDGAMEPLLAGAHAEQFPLFQLMRLTARVVQEALTHTWIQTDRFSRFLSDITKEAHKGRTRAAVRVCHDEGFCRAIFPEDEIRIWWPWRSASMLPTARLQGPGRTWPAILAVGAEGLRGWKFVLIDAPDDTLVYDIGMFSEVDRIWLAAARGQVYRALEVCIEKDPQGNPKLREAFVDQFKLLTAMALAATALLSRSMHFNHPRDTVINVRRLMEAAKN